MTLYGYYHCSCIYESAHALVSLHMTKAGAYRAMRNHIWQAAMKEREDWFAFGRKYGMSKGERMTRHESWHVKAVEVRP